MSEQVRFKIEGCKVNPDLASICITFVKDENGEYVRYEDYARLKSEVEAQAKRWAESEDLISHYKQQMDEAINDCQCSRLKAEVERLRKAGDEIIHEWSSGHGTDVENFTKALWVWAVAKEGKPSV